MQYSCFLTTNTGRFVSITHYTPTFEFVNTWVLKVII